MMGVTDDAALKDEVRMAVEARRELGDDMEAELVDAFVARIERRLAQRDKAGELALQRKREHQKEMVLGSMAISVPLFLFAALWTGLAGVIAVCVALVAIAVISTRS
jgi:hypothetical protein